MVLVSYLQLTLPSVDVICGLVQLLQLPLFTLNTEYTHHHTKSGGKKKKKTKRSSVHFQEYISHPPPFFFFLNVNYTNSFLLSSNFHRYYPGQKEILTWILGSTSSSSSALCNSSSFSEGSIFRGSWGVFLGWERLQTNCRQTPDKATTLGAGQTGSSSGGPRSTPFAMHGVLF